jgi:hypothetical protein
MTPGRRVAVELQGFRCLRDVVQGNGEGPTSWRHDLGSGATRLTATSRS